MGYICRKWKEGRRGPARRGVWRRRAIGGNKKHDDVYAWKRPVKPISSAPNLTKNHKNKIFF